MRILTLIVLLIGALPALSLGGEILGRIDGAPNQHICVIDAAKNPLQPTVTDNYGLYRLFIPQTGVHQIKVCSSGDCNNCKDCTNFVEIYSTANPLRQEFAVTGEAGRRTLQRR